MSLRALRSPTLELSRLDERNGQPLVSILMSNYNYGQFLKPAIDSVLAQSYPHFELIVCDDGSTDDSDEVLAFLERQDPRISVIYKENGGQASAWNAAYQRSSGRIICFLDSDDMFTPEKLDTIVNIFQENAGAGLVNHRYQMVNVHGKPIGTAWPPDLESGWLGEVAAQRGGWKIDGFTPIMCFRRELAETLFPIPEDLGGFGDAYIHGAAQFMTEVAYAPDVLCWYRIHGSNDSGTFQPTRKSLETILSAFMSVNRHLQTFLETSGIAEGIELNVEEIPFYWDHVLALYVMSGKPREGINGYDRHTMFGQMHKTTGGRKKWAVVLALPNGPSQAALRFWWKKTWWKLQLGKLIRRIQSRSTGETS